MACTTSLIIRLKILSVPWYELDKVSSHPTLHRTAAGSGPAFGILSSAVVEYVGFQRGCLKLEEEDTGVLERETPGAEVGDKVAETCLLAECPAMCYVLGVRNYSEDVSPHGTGKAVHCTHTTLQFCDRVI